ncbi:MAG TPA: molecular chaperone HtpG [Clostridiales bacterium]|nr:molecular chaperone HtpG [Clostridiales bacterium]
MQKKQFQAESKRLLELMINSIYTHKEIFLRELISNASDALDKMYYKALIDSSIKFNKDDYYIRISIDKDARTLTISDTGIGMTKEELESNLGTIAKSGSWDFKQSNEQKEDINIIGQFGVGFYSAFMVARHVQVISKAFGAEQAFVWESDGVEGYTIAPAQKDTAGTDIILTIKPSSDEENYDEFLEEYKIRSLVKKYSDFIRYPIKMLVTKSRQKEGTKDEYEDYKEDEILNSMVPIWRKNKSELKPEDYEKFYEEKHYGFSKPLSYIHLNLEGITSFRAILYIPENVPFDYYSKEYQKGLELYSNGVLVMSKCADLLPDYFAFVQGLVDSESLSLNISRELLQQDRQLKFIAQKIKEKIKSELLNMLEKERDKYLKFFKNFGKTLKYGVYANFGADKEDLQDLLVFYSSKEKKEVTLSEYVLRMPQDQKYIYYATGESIDRIAKLPQTEAVADKGYEILFFTDDIDEFAIKMMGKYKEKEFKSLSESGDLGLDNDQKDEKKDEKYKDLFQKAKEILKDKVKDVRASQKLKTHPVCISSEGALSLEMEKVLQGLPDNPGVKAEKILEINTSHDVFRALEKAYQDDEPKFELYINLLYDQALIIEGLAVADPMEFSNNICKLMV